MTSFKSYKITSYVRISIGFKVSTKELTWPIYKTQIQNVRKLEYDIV